MGYAMQGFSQGVNQGLTWRQKREELKEKREEKKKAEELKVKIETQIAKAGRDLYSKINGDMDMDTFNKWQTGLLAFAPEVQSHFSNISDYLHKGLISEAQGEMELLDSMTDYLVDAAQSGADIDALIPEMEKMFESDKALQTFQVYQESAREVAEQARTQRDQEQARLQQEQERAGAGIYDNLEDLKAEHGENAEWTVLASGGFRVLGPGDKTTTTNATIQSTNYKIREIQEMERRGDIPREESIRMQARVLSGADIIKPEGPEDKGVEDQAKELVRQIAIDGKKDVTPEEKQVLVTAGAWEQVEPYLSGGGEDNRNILQKGLDWLKNLGGGNTNEATDYSYPGGGAEDSISNQQKTPTADTNIDYRMLSEDELYRRAQNNDKKAIEESKRRYK